MKELLLRMYGYLLTHYPHARIAIIHTHHPRTDVRPQAVEHVSVWINNNLYMEKDEPQLREWLEREAPEV